MPPRKEPKETVVYPASKRKAPPFKPQRPSKVSRVGSVEVECAQPSTKTKVAAKPVAAVRRREVVRMEEDEDEDEESSTRPGRGTIIDASDSDEELDDNPLATAASEPRKSKPNTSTTARRKQSSRTASPPSRRASHASLDQPTSTLASASQTLHPDATPAIPQPLLVRLLHEHFADKSTRIDKHAVQVLQKYFEVFVREAVARAKMKKEEDAAATGEEDVDGSLLELEDLEKVAAGMLLDF